jgi:hypothetical protein
MEACKMRIEWKENSVGERKAFATGEDSEFKCRFKIYDEIDHAFRVCGGEAEKGFYCDRIGVICTKCQEKMSRPGDKLMGMHAAIDGGEHMHVRFERSRAESSV